MRDTHDRRTLSLPLPAAAPSKHWDIFAGTKWIATRPGRSAKAAIAKLRREEKAGRVCNVPALLSASPALLANA